ncbi:MAG: hypothetical protein WC565_04035 [Parcubacteria group bacterium]
MKETELAATLLQFFADEGWETWQEVTLPDGGRADIVAMQAPVVWIVETKTSLSLEVIEQACARVGYAHLASIAVPEAKSGRSNFHRKVLAMDGIGMFEVGEPLKSVYDTPRVREKVRPKLHRKAVTTWTKSLCEMHKTALAAGSKPGGQWTPFRQTCRDAAGYVKRHPGCTLRELFDNISHHYHTAATARSSFVKRVEDGLVPEIELRRGDKCWTLWPRKEKEDE